MYKKQHVAYVILVAIIVGSFGISAITRDDRDLSSSYNWSQLGQVVGVAGRVAPNEVNIFAQELEERQKELDEREQELLAREQGLFVEDRGIAIDGTMLMATVGLLLLVLILLNFFLDWRRGRREKGV